MTDLYTLTACSYLQYLTSAIGYLEQARDQASELAVSLEDMVNASLFPDMLPLHFQVITIAHFSDTAMHAASTSMIGGPNMDLKLDFQGLIDHLNTARSQIVGLDKEQVNAAAGGEVIFQYGDTILPFTTEDFFLTYALPSFYFHVSIAFGILRSLGVHIGVAHFLGAVRATPSPSLPASAQQLTGAQYLDTLKPLALPQ